MRSYSLKKTEKAITAFFSTQGIDWHFIPERAPHFGGLWEAAVKSFKNLSDWEFQTEL